MDNIFARRVEAIRTKMQQNGWDAVIISGSDPHSSEYVAKRWLQVAWVSGFTGEAGDIVITANHAGLWTDTRYFIQAEKQLAGTGIELHKTNIPEQILIPEWLARHAFTPTHHAPSVVVAIDGLCQTVSVVQDIRQTFAQNHVTITPHIEIVPVPDLLNDLWTDRPEIPATPITTLDIKFCGVSRLEKISWLREEILKYHCDTILLTALDEIAWLLNVRGSDIDYNPVVLSYLLVSQNDVRWFVRKNDTPDPVTAETFSELTRDGIQICDYKAIFQALTDLTTTDRVIFADPSTLSESLHQCLLNRCDDHSPYVAGTSPIILQKSLKNETEIESMRQAHFVDGIAVTRFLHWLENKIQSGAQISEWDAAVQLGRYRSEIPEYRGDSFETISAWGAGAALPHYITPKDGSTFIGNHGLYLCDSGGQYLFGTTDITRTVATGPCTDLEKEDYTLVLQGHIRLALALFPKGTAGCQIDVLAREPLWRTRRNFGHGTGHGVGFYLNVHEGPQNIRQGFKNQPLLPGMITSNEPGLYREGMHGIRHENLVLCTSTGQIDFGREWLQFETLTLCYFDTAPIIPGILHDDEKQWLNDYNERVFQTLAPHLDADDAQWLRKKTQAI